MSHWVCLSVRVVDTLIIFFKIWRDSVFFVVGFHSGALAVWHTADQYVSAENEARGCEAVRVFVAVLASAAVCLSLDWFFWSFHLLIFEFCELDDCEWLGEVIILEPFPPIREGETVVVGEVGVRRICGMMEFPDVLDCV